MKNKSELIFYDKLIIVKINLNFLKNCQGDKQDTVFSPLFYYYLNSISYTF